MRLEKLGERRAIEVIKRHLDLMPKMPVPFGDDVSAFEIGDGNLAVLKTDMLVDKTDVPSGMSLWQAARKAVVMNISDFAAKGVRPIAILVSLGLPRNVTKRNLEEIASGLNAGAREYGAYILGGDTGEASDLVISVSLFGIARKNTLMLRTGAKPGDVLAVTGSFGKTSAGLKILTDRIEVPNDVRRILVESVLMPHARLKEGLALCGTKAVDASIDSSDGLAWSLHEMGAASKVGILVDSLPIAEEAGKFAMANKLDPSALVLYGGEEYELVLAIKPSMWAGVERAVNRIGGRLLRIGRIVADRRIVMKSCGKHMTIEPRGYEHFRT